jgi:hypothetical protein
MWRFPFRVLRHQVPWNFPVLVETRRLELLEVEHIEGDIISREVLALLLDCKHLVLISKTMNPC